MKRNQQNKTKQNNNIKFAKKQRETKHVKTTKIKLMTMKTKGKKTTCERGQTFCIRIMTIAQIEKFKLQSKKKRGEVKHTKMTKKTPQ